MKFNLKPETSLGKWAVGLQSFFVLVIVVSIFLVKVVGVLRFEDRWWDVTVLVFLVSIMALIIGIRALRKHNERSILLFISNSIGVCVVLFLLLHSLFISD